MADSTLISSSLFDREKVSIHQGMMWQHQQQPMRGGSIAQTDYRAGKCTSVTLDPNISIFPPSFSDTQSPKSQGICSFWSRHMQYCIDTRCIAGLHTSSTSLHSFKRSKAWHFQNHSIFMAMMTIFLNFYIILSSIDFISMTHTCFQAGPFDLVIFQCYQICF